MRIKIHSFFVLQRYTMYYAVHIFSEFYMPGSFKFNQPHAAWYIVFYSSCLGQFFPIY